PRSYFALLLSRAQLSPPFPYTTLFRSIVAGFGEAEAERLDWAPATHLGRDRGDRTGIDPTTQEQPERHITGELLTDRSLELLPEIGRAHVLTPVTIRSRMPSSA